MKKATLAVLLTLASVSLFAGEGHKSCDMKGKDAKSISVTGQVHCKGTDDCTFQTADAKVSYTLCEMSKAELPKLSESHATVTVSGKLITCEGKEKLQIEHVDSK